MELYRNFKDEIDEALLNNDAKLFDQILSHCFNLGYEARKLDIARAEDDARRRGMEYKVNERSMPSGIQEARECAIGDIITLRSDKALKIQGERRLQVVDKDPITIFLGEIGNKSLKDMVLMLRSTTRVKLLPNGEYITFGQYSHF